MKTNISLILLILAVFVQFTACEPTSKSATGDVNGLSVDSLKAAEALIQEYIDKGELAGFSALVIKDDQEVLRFTKGFAEKENYKPMEKNTIFRIFSMTKPVTAVALMTLYDRGKFELDDKVSKYIPEFEGIKVYTPVDKGFSLEPQETEMTIRHLLTHTSGISYGWNPNSYVDSLYAVSKVSAWETELQENMRKLSEIPLNFQPGTEWMYGLSIDVAGYLVEVLSGMSLDKYFQENIFGPLKMDDSGFYVPEDKYERLCGAYLQNKGEPLKLISGNANDFRELPIHFSGGGGLVSTIDDYSRFCQMLLNKGELDGVRILETETAALVMSNQLPSTAKYEGGKRGYGLGAAIDLKSNEYSWSGVASTTFWINPTNNMIVITCTQISPMNLSYGIKFKRKIDEALVEEKE